MAAIAGYRACHRPGLMSRRFWLRRHGLIFDILFIVKLSDNIIRSIPEASTALS